MAVTNTSIDIQVLCMLPECFLRHCIAEPVLSNMFQTMSHERYSKMMIEILQKICYETTLSDQNVHVPSHAHLKITSEHKAAWLRCFDKALNDLSVDDIRAKTLQQRLSGLLDEITVIPKRRSIEICHSIKEAVSCSNNPHEFISEIRHYLDRIDSLTP